MTLVNIHDAKTNLSKYLALVEAGEEIWIGRYGKPIVKLVPLSTKGQRKPGILAGKIWIDDDFDDPDPELIAAMEKDLD